MVVPRPEVAKSRDQSLTGGSPSTDRHSSWKGEREGVPFQLEWRKRGGQDSRTATTPWPPAAQMEIRPRLPGPASDRVFASVATIRPPVAANGCPVASD